MLTDPDRGRVPISSTTPFEDLRPFVETINHSRRRLIAEMLQRRPQECPATVAFVEETEFLIHLKAITPDAGGGRTGAARPLLSDFSFCGLGENLSEWLERL